MKLTSSDVAVYELLAAVGRALTAGEIRSRLAHRFDSPTTTWRARKRLLAAGAIESEDGRFRSVCAPPIVRGSTPDRARVVLPESTPEGRDAPPLIISKNKSSCSSAREDRETIDRLVATARELVAQVERLAPERVGEVLGDRSRHACGGSVSRDERAPGPRLHGPGGSPEAGTARPAAPSELSTPAPSPDVERALRQEIAEFNRSAKKRGRSLAGAGLWRTKRAELERDAGRVKEALERAELEASPQTVSHGPHGHTEHVVAPSKPAVDVSRFEDDAETREIARRLISRPVDKLAAPIDVNPFKSLGARLVSRFGGRS